MITTPHLETILMKRIKRLCDLKLQAEKENDLINVADYSSKLYEVRRIIQFMRKERKEIDFIG